MSGISRDNNFDSLRLIAAFLVVYIHLFQIYGLPYPILINASVCEITIGNLGVTIFFYYQWVSYNSEPF